MIIEQKIQYNTMNYTINVPFQMRYILAFDVETNGLIPKKKEIDYKMAKLPYILQLSFVIYDLHKRKIFRKYDTYIKVDNSVEISEFITELTGITSEKCKRGKKITDALNDFYDAYMLCQGLIAHNMDFDKNMILIEIERNREIIMKKIPYCINIFDNVYEKINIIERYCTMRKGIFLCNIEMKPNNKRKKFPKLSELYCTLFKNESIPKNLHNSLIDVLVCLRCYLKMRHNYNFDDYNFDDYDLTI
jgi:DNA polymerase III epsilon subunit-like protein